MKANEAKYDRWVEETLSGKLVGYVCVDNFRFNSKYNKVTGVVTNDTDEGFAQCTDPDINAHVREGFLVERFAFRHEHTIAFPWEKKTLTKQQIVKVVQEFKHHGFDVTYKAIKNNYDYWRNGWKVGYRDEENGYHIFTPAGDCNPLSFHVTALCKQSEDWQTTYEC